MEKSEYPKKLVGTLNVLFRKDLSQPLEKEEDLDWSDYVPVYSPLPIPEFDPHELLAGLASNPPKWGELPRHLRELDVIQVCPANRGMPNMALLVVDTRGTMQSQLHRKNSVICVGSGVEGFGLLILGIIRPNYLLTHGGTIER